MNNEIIVVGAGLAGSEAAWQIAETGVRVRLIEMKPSRKSPAHKSDAFCELVCSNSLRSDDITVASGLLKEELRRLGSLIMRAADASRVKAGSALAVDRDKFSETVTDALRSHPMITVESRELTEIPQSGVTVIATGPLTSDALASEISRLIGGKSLFFFDAAAPIVDYASIDMTRAFFASRYDKGTPDYINCPMSKAEYEAFYRELIGAEIAKMHDFEGDPEKMVFEGCMPVEVMAKRGENTLLFGPLKPVGITNPITGEKYYAVVQLRRENAEGTMYNLVGFQTHLTFPEQKRVFGMIPALANAEYHRFGVMHRNTFMDSPKLLKENYELASRDGLFFAGQMTGVEGYIESAASGFVAGLAASCRLRSVEMPKLDQLTMIGALENHVRCGPTSGKFQPMNASFGLVAQPSERIKGGKAVRYGYYAKRALEEIDRLAVEINALRENDNENRC